MKLLFDQNLSFKLASGLSDLFPGSTQVRLMGLGDASDHEIWRVAASEGFAIVTLDADFFEMAALYGSPPQVIWLRCGNRSTSFVEALLRRHAARIRALAGDAEAGCLEIR